MLKNVTFHNRIAKLMLKRKSVTVLTPTQDKKEREHDTHRASII